MNTLVGGIILKHMQRIFLEHRALGTPSVSTPSPIHVMFVNKGHFLAGMGPSTGQRVAIKVRLAGVPR